MTLTDLAHPDENRSDGQKERRKKPLTLIKGIGYMSSSMGPTSHKNVCNHSGSGDPGMFTNKV